MTSERLDRILAGTGRYSRAEARKAVRAGRVTAGGETVLNPETRVSRESDIRVDGEPVDTAPFTYWMLHKPAGYVSSSEDERLPSVLRLLPDPARKRGVFCVGRLDADVTGLLILTDDGAYAHRVTSPRSSVEKTYEVTLDTPVRREDVTRLAEGAVKSDGQIYRPARLEPDENDPCRARITVTEGRFHEVKNLMAICGHKVLSMRRLSIGALRLDDSLPVGGSRQMTADEALLALR